MLRLIYLAIRCLGGLRWSMRHYQDAYLDALFSVHCPVECRFFSDLEEYL